MRIFIILFVTISLFQCKNKEYASFGKTITDEGYIDSKSLLTKYSALKEKDTIDVKVKAKIKNVCKKKGCWVTFDLDESKETFVKFKDYGFFMPLNANGYNAIINGKAFIAVETVESLKHYAKDEGKSQEEIDKITQPEVTYSFISDGVLLEKTK